MEEAWKWEGLKGKDQRREKWEEKRWKCMWEGKVGKVQRTNRKVVITIIVIIIIIIIIII